MERYKALLIGASNYAYGIRPLPFVREDLRRLGAALSERGFRSVDLPETGCGVTRGFVRGEVSRFLREGKPGDTLLIVLSGHGQHFEGTDYLVPEDASFDIEPFSDGCVGIDWRTQLDRTEAAQVVFLIDACREGFDRAPDGMAPRAGIEKWGRRQIDAGRRRKVAYVYACSPGEVARFVRETDAARDGEDVGTAAGESFSLFSRAVCDVVGGHRHALGLDEFRAAVQNRVDELRRAYGKKPQEVRVLTETPERFTVFPGPPQEDDEHPWVRAVNGHPAWDKTGDLLPSARDALREAATAAAVRLAAEYQRAAASFRDDPWHDEELGLRAHDRMAFLVGKITEKTPLSPTEAALVALLPFVGQAFWAQEAARKVSVLDDENADTGRAPGAGGRTPDGLAFDTFAGNYPRLRRRLRRIAETGVGKDSERHIRWWMFRRWLLRQPEVYRSEAFEELLGPCLTDLRNRPVWLDAALSPQRLARFLREQRTAPFTVPRADALAASDPVAPATVDEHHVREPLVACLAKCAQALAVDALDLPEVVVEHLGISDSVDLDALRTTLRGAGWLPVGMGRTLHATCQHPAVELSLQEHAGCVDGLLRDINQAAAHSDGELTPLRALPPYANADKVRPKDGGFAGLSSGIRFHLAEDRVQELLMGESLYGDRGLAIRELYQNALDACRYRDVRTQYLTRTGRRTPKWEGLIEFDQGIDDSGRPYLDCRDNGIGMGVSELSRTFSQGGTRFVDLPEYVEEQADWAALDPPLRLHPNSRFGIGVLSYFMLADEITVHTCRLDQEGRPGHLLRVTIAGPGNLFRIEDLGPGDDAGTTVRLHLAPRTKQPSCVEELPAVLWVAPYRTRATVGSTTLEWEPGILRRHRLLENRPAPDSRQYFSGTPDLWWSQEDGVVLADGLSVGTKTDRIVIGRNRVNAPFGVVVNLHGPSQPELTVDRTSIRSYDEEKVQAMMAAALPAFMDTARDLMSPKWLEKVCESSYHRADAIADQARTSGLTWPVADDTEAAFGDVGHFPPDAQIVALLTGQDRFYGGGNAHPAALIRSIPENVLRWRLLAWYRALAPESLSPRLRESAEPGFARPSDIVLLCRPGSDWSRWSERAQRWLSAPPEHAYRQSPRTDWNDSLSLLFRWRTADVQVSAVEVFSLLQTIGQDAARIADRLAELGFEVPPLGPLRTLTRSDLPLLHPMPYSQRWLVPGTRLSAAQVGYSAARARCSPAAAAGRLGELGFGIPEGFPFRTEAAPSDHAVMTSIWSWNSELPEDGTTGTLTLAQVTTAALRLNRSVHALCRFLRESGFVVPPDEALPDALGPDDLALLEWSDYSPMVDRPVPGSYLRGVAQRTGRDVAAVAARLGELGYRTDAENPPSAVLGWQELNNLFNVRYGQMNRFGQAHPFHPRTSPEQASKEAHALSVHTGRTMSEAQEFMRMAWGEQMRLPDTFRQDLAAEEALVLALRGRHGVPPDVPARISLPAVAAAAALSRTTFQRAAQEATRLGMGHEAEDWFTHGLP